MTLSLFSFPDPEPPVDAGRAFKGFQLEELGPAFKVKNPPFNLDEIGPAFEVKTRFFSFPNPTG